MPNKYYRFKVAGYYLYFTSKCIVEAMHVHASNRKLTEACSAKFFVLEDGSTTLEEKGNLTATEINIISKFIKANYLEMYRIWKEFGGAEFFGSRK